MANKCAHCTHSEGTTRKGILDCHKREQLVYADDSCELWEREPGAGPNEGDEDE